MRNEAVVDRASNDIRNLATDSVMWLPVAATVASSLATMIYVFTPSPDMALPVTAVNLGIVLLLLIRSAAAVQRLREHNREYSFGLGEVQLAMFPAAAAIWACYFLTPAATFAAVFFAAVTYSAVTKARLKIAAMHFYALERWDGK